jgi:2-phosphosulfolactate phosphatase
MLIQRLSLREGAHAAQGVAVIIDVFRAFTCEPLMYHYGAQQILLEADPETCLAMAGTAVLVGERDEMPIPGFHLTNSPFLIMHSGRDFFGQRRVIHRTTSGVTGALAALETADEVLLASFVNASATAKYILSRRPKLVSLVAMGIRSLEKAPEDEYCGDYIESLLTAKAYDHIRAMHHILAHETAQKFLRGDKTYLPREDPAICLQRDLFDFALRVQQRGDLVEALRVSPGPKGVQAV